jgi:hypothetical protein
MKPSKNCEFVIKGTSDIAYIGLPNEPEDLVAYLKALPHLTAAQFEDADEGVYTWLFASTDGSAPTFAATRTLHDLELGTVHYALATSVGATHVHGAGEVWKHGSLFTFNFLSGTFMEKWVLPEGCTLDIMQSLLQEKLKETFPYLTRAKQIAFLPKGETFITQRFLGSELSAEDLEEWVKAGFKVCVHGFDPRNPKEDRARAHAQCKATRATCKKPVTVEQMKGGKIVTLNAIGEEVPANDPSAVKRFDTNTYKELPLGGRRRKTKTGKKVRRKTRRRYRGGDGLDPTHVGVRMAESLVGPKEGPPPLLQMFERLKTELKLTDAQVEAMIRAYSEATEDDVYPEEDEFRRYLIDRFDLKSRR